MREVLLSIFRNSFQFKAISHLISSLYHKFLRILGTHLNYSCLEISLYPTHSISSIQPYQKIYFDSGFRQSHYLIQSSNKNIKISSIYGHFSLQIETILWNYNLQWFLKGVDKSNSEIDLKRWSIFQCQALSNPYVLQKRKDNQRSIKNWSRFQIDHIFRQFLPLSWLISIKWVSSSGI